MFISGYTNTGKRFLLLKLSRTSTNGHLFPAVTSLQRPFFIFGRKVHTFTLLSPLYNGHFPRCPQGGRRGEFQLSSDQIEIIGKIKKNYRRVKTASFTFIEKEPIHKLLGLFYIQRITGFIVDSPLSLPLFGVL